MSRHPLLHLFSGMKKVLFDVVTTGIQHRSHLLHRNTDISAFAYMPVLVDGSC